MEGAKYEEGETRLHPGDRVVLYTDGISEAANAGEEQFGDERLVDLVRSLPRELTAREVAQRILDALHHFLGPVEPQDDMTLLVIRAVESVPATAAAPSTREVVTAN